MSAVSSLALLPPVDPVSVGSLALRAEIVAADDYRRHDAAWAALAARAAEPNAMLDPEMLAAASAGASAQDKPVLLVWAGERLAGVWAFARAHAPSGLPVSMLTIPFHESFSNATPVIDREMVEPVLAAMFDAIAHGPSLPKLIYCNGVDTSGPAMAGLRAVLATRGTAAVMLGEARRPMMGRGQGENDAEAYAAKAMSGSRRSKLRQLRRKLASRGNVETRVHKDQTSIATALERFMALEADGWKGQFGSPLLLKPELAAFARSAISGLAARGRAEIWEMTLNGATVSSLIVLRSGSRVFTWKVTYDETHGYCSPGVLLGQDCTAGFLADDTLTMADSAAQVDTGLFGGLWSERETMATLMLDARRGGSSQLALVGNAERLYRSARQFAKVPYNALRLKLRRFAKAN